MKGNHNNPNFILNKAIAALRNDQPDAQAVETATANVWQRISQELALRRPSLP